MARIALVERDSELADQLQPLLAIEDYAVVRYTDGGEALLAIQDGSFDLVVAGLQTPQFDGRSLCRALRAQRGKRELPVLLVAQAGQGDLLAGYEAGANDYLVAPFVPERVAEKLEAHLSNRAAPPAGERSAPLLGDEPPELPCAFDAFVLTELIGRGGYAYVYRAQAPGGETVALKLFHGDIEDDRTVLARYFREVALLDRLDSPFIVKVHSSGYAQGRFYIAMELVQGRSTAELLAESGPFRFKTALRIGLEMAEALTAFEGAGLVHRDVKPANIVLRPDGRSVLIDLGLAKDLGQPGVTDVHELLGTAAYLSPETIRGDPETIARDVYGLGVTIFTLLCGETPHAIDDEYLLLRTVGSGRRARKLNSVRCDTRDAISAFVGKLLDPLAERRPTPQEAAAGFQQLLRM